MLHMSQHSPTCHIPCKIIKESASNYELNFNGHNTHRLTTLLDFFVLTRFYHIPILYYFHNKMVLDIYMFSLHMKGQVITQKNGIVTITFLWLDPTYKHSFIIQIASLHAWVATIYSAYARNKETIFDLLFNKLASQLDNQNMHLIVHLLLYTPPTKLEFT